MIDNIRNVALGLALKDNKLLVQKIFDKINNVTLYRCLGGGIENNELPRDAIKREFLEELNSTIVVNKQLGIIDSKFIYNGKPAHEIVYLFDIKFPEKDYKENYTIIDDGIISFCEWIDVEEFKNGTKILVPKDVVKYL